MNRFLLRKSVQLPNALEGFLPKPKKTAKYHPLYPSRLKPPPKKNPPQNIDIFIYLVCCLEERIHSFIR